jgi:hypothetical protein
MRHAAPAAQALPHAPQLATSDEVVTQRPLQRLLPGGQTQALFTHAWPSAQLTPQPPQFDGFDRVSTH